MQSSSAQHRTASQLLRRLAEGREPWGLPWPCVYEFLKVVTHPRAFRPPLPATAALRAVRSVVAAPSVQMLAETPRHPEFLAQVIEDSGCRGNLMHDAHIWALCLEHGVDELWSADQDFHRFRGLRHRNPFRTP